MKLIYNNIIPFKGFAAINILGILFVRKGVKVSQQMMNHEAIHSAQMKELLYIGFYIWYVLEWIVRLFQCGFKAKLAYYCISFEKEAYAHDNEPDYLTTRQCYAFLRQ